MPVSVTAVCTMTSSWSSAVKKCRSVGTSTTPSFNHVNLGRGLPDLMHCSTVVLPAAVIWSSIRCTNDGASAAAYNNQSTVKHVYFASIKFSRTEKNHEIKCTQIFGTAHHPRLICIEYQHFHDMMCNIIRNTYSKQ